MDGTTLAVGLFAGAIGLAYLAYGKKASNLWFVLLGVLLLAYPYFVSSQMALVLIGILLLVCPFIADRIF